MTRPSDTPSGRCPVCSRRRRVTDKGVLAMHERAVGYICSGSGLPPKGSVR